MNLPTHPHPTQRPRLSGGVPFIGMILVGCLPGPLKRAYYRFRGARIGNGVALGMFSYIQSPELSLADEVSIAPFTFIRTRTHCRIGARSRIHAFTAIDTGALEIGEDTSILEQVTIGGMLTPRSLLRVGSRTKILSFAFINPTEPVVIEDDVCIGGGTYLFAHGTWQSMLDGFPGSFGPVTVKRGAWLAWRCFVMPGITIGEYATVGAASVVTRDVAARTLAVGSPAKPIKTGREYIREIGSDEQHALLMKWLEEFAAYLSYTGQDASFVAQSHGATLQMLPAGVTIAYYQNNPPAAHNGQLIISLGALNEAQRRNYSASGLGWFDLAARECSLGTHTLWSETRQFLSRYGVRFAVVTP